MTIEPKPVVSNASGPTRSSVMSAGRSQPGIAVAIDLARRVGVERIECAENQKRPDSPLHRRDLEPALCKRAIESEQAIDDVMGQGNLDSDRNASAQPRNRQLHDQAWAPHA